MSFSERMAAQCRARIIRIKQEGWDKIAAGPPDRPVITGYMVNGEFVSFAKSIGRISPMLIDNYEAVTIPASEWLEQNPRPKLEQA